MPIGNDIWTWFKGDWTQANLPILGSADHATWQGTLVFDGARLMNGYAPDLMLHCERVVRSADAMGLASPYTPAEIRQIIQNGIRHFKRGVDLYLRPMMWSTEGSENFIDADPNSTEIAIVLEAMPMSRPGPFSLTVSPFKRPHQDTALTEAKAACLYPNNGRIVREASKRGFNNALSLDLDGFVAETASTNVFMLKDGVYYTPVPNGTFLNGITRQRVIKLLVKAGHEVVEKSLTVEDFAAADEIFTTGNANKVQAVSRFETRELPTEQGLMVRQLYWDYAESKPAIR
ncbi:MAG TPA: branched-chain amino acid aminotransferase [Rhodobacteraceae bacterium]|nr:branched-chain amino acid aminotransferase [Paracoccaceae bacterium]